MCGRFSQSLSREDYLTFIANDAERVIPFDPQPIDRFNVAPGTRVLLLSERNEALHLDPVYWGYAPGWWDNAPPDKRPSRNRRDQQDVQAFMAARTGYCFCRWMVRVEERGRQKTALLYSSGRRESPVYGGNRQYTVQTRRRSGGISNRYCCR